MHEPNRQDSPLLAPLSDEQREAVTHEGGPLIVLAGPGAGKTFAIVRRAAWLIENGTDPASILVLTFTNKAAAELSERLADLVGAKASAIQASTFHALGMRLVRRFGDLAGVRANAQLIDSAQRRRMRRELIAQHGLYRDAAAEGMEAILDRASADIARLHQTGLFAEEAAGRLDAIASREAQNGDDAAPVARAARLLDSARLWELETAERRRLGLIGFDDLITLPAQVLERHAEARGIVRTDCRRVLVDEFQDVDAAQIRLLAAIAPPAGAGGTPPDLCVVGDDDQSIYGFRGADQFAFERFGRIWGGSAVRTVTLTHNRRSQRPIIEAANAVIARAHHRFDASKVGRRPPESPDDPTASVELVRLDETGQAAQAVAAMIALDRRDRPDAAWNDYAVICRSRGMVAAVRDALEMERITAAAIGRPSAMDDRAVQDVIAWAEAVTRPDLTHPVQRLLRRPPLDLPLDHVAAWDLAYRSELSRLDEGERDGTAPAFIGWLADLADKPGIEPEHAAALRRLKEWTDRFGRSAANERASDAILDIIRTTGVAEADLPEGRARARRVSALVGLVRFARDRQDRLPAPGGLRELLDYLEDLDEQDRRLDTADPLADSEAEAEFEDDPERGGGAVRLLTAHASKGLAFDTVFVPRVQPMRGGFPDVQTPDDADRPPPELGWEPAAEGRPAGSGDDEPDARRRADDPKLRTEDEERRVFYVACTRARRRLVLLGRVPKSSKSMNFMVELMGPTTGIPDGLPTRDAGELIAEAARSNLISAVADEFDQTADVPAWKAAEKRRIRLDAIRREARRRASAALDAAELGAADQARFDDLAGTLRDAAAALAAIEPSRAGLALPGWLADHAQARRVAEELASFATNVEPRRGLAAHPLPPPLSLSYTTIRAYMDCPACFYLRHVLKLPEPFSPNLVVGSVLHKALECWTNLRRDAEAEGQPPPDPETLYARADRDLLAAWPANEPLDPAERARLRAQLAAFVDMDQADDEILEVETKFELPYDHAGSTHTIRGKIDRIDRTRSGELRLIDFKTGRATNALLDPAPSDTQFGVYALALPRIPSTGADDGRPPRGVAEYWLLATRERGVVSLDRVARSEPTLRKRINAVIDGMLAGDFRPDPGCRDGLCRDLLPV